MKNRYIRLLLMGLVVSALFLISGRETGQIQAREFNEKSKKEQSSTVTEAALSSAPISETKPITDPITIKKQVLIDESGIKITARKWITDGLWGSGVELFLENTTDKDAGIGCEALIVNNCMIDNMLLATVPAGEQVTETLWLADKFLDAAGIQTVGQVEVKFIVYDKETRKSLIKNDFVSIHTSAYEDMDSVTEPEGTVLFEEKGVRILGNYSNVDPIYGSAVWLFAENHSGRNLNLISMNVTVNGTQIPAMCSGPLFDDKVSYYHLLINLEKLKEQGIPEPKEIEIQFSFIDLDSDLMIAGPFDAVIELKETS